MVEATPRQKLANLVRELRGEKSQRNFAKLLGVSYYAVQSWEKHTVWPDNDNLQKLADLKEWSLSELQVYLQVPINVDDAVDKFSKNSGFVRSLDSGHSTKVRKTNLSRKLCTTSRQSEALAEGVRESLAVAELVAKVRALPFEEAVQVAQAALEVIAVKGA